MKKLFILFCLLLSLSFAGRLERPIGLYISWWTMHYPQRMEQLIAEAKKYQFNTLVCDFRGDYKAVYKQNFEKAKKAGYYLIARVVVFEEGIGADYKSAQNQEHWLKKKAEIKVAEQMGFDEIQLDYIRFADAGWGDPKKTEIITGIVKEAKESLSVPMGIDVFGSVSYQAHRLIGQDLRKLAPHIDAVSSMLYPSHFLKDRRRMGNPYATMLEGSYMTKGKIAGHSVRNIPYIQSFPMNMSYYGKSLKEYIKDQLRAVEDAGTDGFFAWHAGNDYSTTFAAISEHGQLYKNSPISTEELRKRISVLSVSGNILSEEVSKVN